MFCYLNKSSYLPCSVSSFVDVGASDGLSTDLQPVLSSADVLVNSALSISLVKWRQNQSQQLTPK